MFRDFTYIDDLVQGIRLLIDTPPLRPASPDTIAENDSLSPAAPYRVVNIGNGTKVGLMEFIHAIEAALGRKAICNFLPMQPGDVPATWAENSLLRDLTGFEPQTDVATGVARFVAWYREYHAV
jgi:UDP-glucuronate 4-epimerase